MRLATLQSHKTETGSRNSRAAGDTLPPSGEVSGGAETVAGLPLPENKLYFPALDGLRAIAVLMVFTAHYFGLPAALNWGWSGVDVFFVLSGFLITGILYDSRDRMHRFQIFYKRRTLRIFPLFYGVLLVAVLLYPIFHWRLHRGLWLWPLYLGNYIRYIWPLEYAGNASIYEDLQSRLHLVMPFSLHFDHLWSLCVEEQFYLIWPLAVYIIKDRVRLRNLCIAAVVLTPLLRLICLHALSPSLIDMRFLYRVTPLRADALLLGGAMALMLRGPRTEAERLLALAKPSAQVLLAVAVGLEVICRVRLGHFIDSGYVILHSTMVYTLIALFAGALILLALDPRSRTYRICSNEKLRALGQRSYGFYVYHLLLLSVYQYVALGICLGHKAYLTQVTAAVALFGTLLVSWASFRYFEEPFLRLKARWAA